MGTKNIISDENLYEPLYLRALEVSDLERCHKWHNDRSFTKRLSAPSVLSANKLNKRGLTAEPPFHPMRSTLLFVSRTQINTLAISTYVRLIGYLGVPSWKSSSATGGERSKGYGQSAIRQLLSYAFNNLGLKRIYLEVLADNGVAIHVYEKFRFRVEGKLKNHVFKQGGWKDLIIMGICAEDYAANKDHGKS